MLISKKTAGTKKEDIILFVHGAWHGASIIKWLEQSGTY